MTEWRASDYNQQSSLQQAMADEVLEKLVLHGTEHILDVGCGDGKITAAMAARVPTGRVLGVDPSTDMINFATKQFGPSTLGNLSFKVADARRLMFQNQFDLVTSFNALHWVSEQGDALAGIHRALKPEGHAVLRFVSEGSRESLEDVIEEVRKQSNWSQSFSGFQKPYAHFTPEAYRAMAEAAGFRVADLRVDDKTWDFKSRDGFAAFARATFVEWTKHLPESEWPAFIDEVLNRYQQVAAAGPSELHCFKFYQMQITLDRTG